MLQLCARLSGARLALIPARHSPISLSGCQEQRRDVLRRWDLPSPYYSTARPGIQPPPYLIHTGSQSLYGLSSSRRRLLPSAFMIQSCRVPLVWFDQKTICEPSGE